MFHKRALLSALCCALAATGCSDDDDNNRPLPQLSVGMLQLNWTIDGQAEVGACEAVGATAFEAVIFDQGYFVTEVEAPCDEFETTLELYVDDYVSRVTLVDELDYAVTRRVVEDFFQINEDQVTRLSVDFPSGSATSSPDAGIVEPLPDAGPIDPGTTDPDTSDPDSTDPGTDDAGTDAAVP